MSALALTLASACTASPREVSGSSPDSPLRLERQIALPDARGRIDHLAIDLAHHLLFVAEYANGSVDEVDILAGKQLGRIAGLHEPQGLAVTADHTQLVVASGDGSVRFYATPDLRPLAQLKLGDDADDVRVDPRQGYVIVGYGDGALAVIDPATHRIVGNLPLPAHPEGFALRGSRVIVNVPDQGAIIAGDLDTGQVTDTWHTGLRHLNFPLSIDPGGQWFATVYRFPAAFEIRASATGAKLAAHAVCGDSDDLFIDGSQLYIICGAGHVDVVSALHPASGVTRVDTSAGARTGLFVPELRKLFVAAPARHGEGAAIWELRVNRAVSSDTLRK